MTIVKISERQCKDRLEYLIRVAIEYIKNNPEQHIFYDSAECDGYCLYGELENELKTYKPYRNIS